MGPIPLSGDGVVTRFREEQKGVYQSIQAEIASGFRTNGQAYGPGRGDLMIALRRAPFRLCRAEQDLDFEYVSDGRVHEDDFVPMVAFVTPGMNSRVEMLTPAERQALAALDPLLADPRAVLPEPRYYRVRVLHIQAGRVSGGLRRFEERQSTVERVVANSTTRDSSSSFTLPIGSILSLIPGVTAPDIGLTSRASENTVTEQQLKTNHSFSNSGGVVVEYEIGDSDPNKEIPVEVYYDTLFRTFAFRDSSTTPLMALYEVIGAESLLEWHATLVTGASDAPEAARFNVCGHLPVDAGNDLLVSMAPEDPKSSAPTYVSTIDAKTGNVLFSDMLPGTYAAFVNGTKVALTLSAEGSVTMKTAE